MYFISIKNPNPLTIASGSFCGPIHALSIGKRHNISISVNADCQVATPHTAILGTNAACVEGGTWLLAAGYNRCFVGGDVDP